ncbi:CapA family protein (plasmid) [Enterococcus sp. 22-H-5-01]|uniref:CapA family protein n=1 Tax=Enterococcus sp. 22-H-5-01 TaxID=3418555 RepID=UPI003D092E02
MVKISIDKLGEVSYENSPKIIDQYGLGNIFILLLILEKIESGELLLTDTVEVNEVIEKEGKDRASIGFKKHDRYSLATLIELQVVTWAPDVSLLLAKLFREKLKKSAQQTINTLLIENKLRENCCKNISGRVKRNDVQQFTINELKFLGEGFSKLTTQTSYYLSLREVYFKENLYKVPSYWSQHEENKNIVWKNNLIHLTHNQLIIVADAEDDLMRDKYLAKILLKEKNEKFYKTNENCQAFDKEDVSITITGDTYPGEWYSNRRTGWDPLKNEGYDYSFKQVKKFFLKSDFNITNLETVLPKDINHSPLKRKKKFVLGGKAKNTLESLKKVGIDLVTLATNHVGDYGSEGVRDTLESLDNYKINRIGSGFSEWESLRPFILETTTQKIVIFNGYWYRRTQYLEYGMYSIDKHLGGNPLSEELCNAITDVKTENKSTKVIVIAHWGVDFMSVNNTQKIWANKLTQAGADLIVGHGPHCLQPVDIINEKDVLYSLGNFVFNSNGEYDTHPYALPYGGILNIKLDNQSARLHLNFIMTDNNRTKFQPKKINKEDFNHILTNFGIDNLNALGWKINYRNLSISKKIW